MGAGLEGGGRRPAEPANRGPAAVEDDRQLVADRQATDAQGHGRRRLRVDESSAQQLLGMVLVHGFRGHFSPQHHHGVELPGIYWHFVDVMWIVVYSAVYLL